jgi:hypothetical protein
MQAEVEVGWEVVEEVILARPAVYRRGQTQPRGVVEIAQPSVVAISAAAGLRISLSDEAQQPAPALMCEPQVMSAQNVSVHQTSP